MLQLLLLFRASGAPAPAPYWPTDGWKTATPESVGMSSNGLADASSFVRLM